MAVRMRDMRFMRIMRIFANMRIHMQMKISPTSSVYEYLPKIAIFWAKKWVSMAQFSILSAQNIIIVHPFWFYPSSEE